MSSVNTIWILLCGTLVFFMQAGFAMLETGFTRAKNAGNIVMKNIIDICIGAPVFWLIGFGIMYGGGLDLFARNDYSSILPDGVSQYAFIFYQIAFCATAATIVSGAMAERTKFVAYCIYSAVISMLVYPIIGHWIWGNGWLAQLGFHDFAGGTVVHTLGGMSALAGAWLLGPRIGKYAKNGKSKAIPGHNITLSALGILILWFGWFGFNGGSTLCMEGDDMLTIAGKVFLNTILAAGTSAVSAMITSKVRYKKPDVSMTLNGILAGLVSITAGCDMVTPFAACIIGILAGIVSVHAIAFVDRVLKVDDPVGAIGVHGFCGILGTLCVGLFSTEKGLFYTGDISFFGVQVLGSVCVIVFSLVVMTLIFFLIKQTVGLRVSEKEEIEGLDSNEHGLNSAYGDFVQNDYRDLLNGNVSEEIVPLENAIPIHLIAPDEHVTSSLSKIEIIMKQSRFDIFKEAMNQIGVTGMTVSKVVGCGAQMGQSDYYRGAQVEVNLLPKIKVEIVVAKVPVDLVVNTARKVLYTGHIGDGKIFVSDIRNVIKVRTGEVDYDAMQGVTE